MWTNIKRIVRAGFVSFWRNSFVSLASILVMTITLFAIGSLIFSNALVSKSLDDLRDKVDINVYFVTTAPEDEILSLKGVLEGLPEVASVEYISRDAALSRFQERHQDDQLTLQALEELEENPLGASLSIKAKETSQYEGVATFLQGRKDALGAEEESIIDNINYFQNKAAIDQLTDIINSSEQSNFAKTVVLVIISILITFNTIRLAIHNAREEIAVMKLVGASNWYARGPFIIEGVMYSVVATILALILFYPVTLWFGPLFYPFSFFSDFEEINLLSFYSDNFALIFLTVLGTGLAVGVLSSYLAVMRYLKV